MCVMCICVCIRQLNVICFHTYIIPYISGIWLESCCCFYRHVKKEVVVDHREILNKQCIHIVFIHRGHHAHCINKVCINISHKATSQFMCYLNRSHVPYLAQNVSPLSLTTISAFPISSEQCDQWSNQLSW